MNILETAISNIDRLQQRTRLLRFVVAVIKKYGDDQAGFQAALLTYYGFWSLFPLLLLLSTSLKTIASHYPALHQTILEGINLYFPGFASSLTVGDLHRTGPALIIGLLFTLYGARGVADVFRNGVNHVWRVPRADRDKFPKSILKSFGIILVGGTGFLFASTVSTIALNAGRGIEFRILAIGLNLFILFWVFTFLLDFCLPGHVPIKKTRSGAASAAVGLVTLQALAGFLLTRELRNLDAVYSYFALSLGLLFWIYLQAQMLYYSVEVASVRAYELFPRSLRDENQTEADRRALKSLAGKERLLSRKQEKIKTTVSPQ